MKKVLFSGIVRLLAAHACWRARRCPLAEGLADVQVAPPTRWNGSTPVQPRERSVLRAIAQSGTIYGAEADLLDLSKGTATHAGAPSLIRVS